MIGFGRVISGLRAAEEGLYVTGNNLTNVNTDGYKRQRVIQSETVSHNNNYLNSVGLGVTVDSIQQVYSELRESVYRNELAALGEYNSKNQMYNDLQTIIGDPMTSMLQGGFEDMWEAANLLETDASSLTYKSTFRQGALSFLEQVENISNQLNKIQNEINGDIETKITQINEYAYQIKDLNKKIGYYEAMNGNANELKDKRDAVIEELSGLINLDVEDCPDGYSKAIRIGGGYLVSSSEVYEIELAQEQEGSVYKIPKWKDSGARVDITSGELKGLLDVRGYDIVANLEHSSNGAPKEKADIVVSIDPNMSADKLTAMKNNISSMLDTLDIKDANYKFYINIMGTNTNVEFNSREEFEDYINNNIDNIGGTQDIFASIDSFSDITFRDDSNKYLMVFSEDSLNGGNAVNSNTLQNGIRQLSSLDMRVIAVTNSDDDTISNSWKTLTRETEGNIYNIEDVESSTGFENVGLSLTRDINSRMDETNATDIIPSIKSKFNSMINAVVRELNSVFRQGENAYGQTHDEDAGINLDLFVKIDENLPFQMGNIELNPLFSDVNNMPLSFSGMAGDNRIGEMLAAVRTENIFNCSVDEFTVDEYYADFIKQIGFDAEDIEVGLDNQTDIVNDADDRRQSVRGVSMDEELANMIKYQYSYGAASKMLTVIDEMLELIVTSIK